MLEIFASSSALAEAAAHAAGQGLARGVRERGRAALVATGGRAPGPVYDRLAGAPVDWARVVVTLSDERFVPPGAPESNAGLLRDRLFRGPPARAAFVPLWRDVETPEDAARQAEPAVRAMAPFDVVLLGMGEDGHVASLIPGSPGLAAGLDPQGERWVMGVPAGTGSPPLARITLTLPALTQAHVILLLIAGDTKRFVVDQALAGADLPVRAILTQDRAPVRVLWSPRHED
ncbi:6-phosphogluconolactonase [Phenylobacterium sp.]|jgi:6-phosphogluconolactonase|uniref:6-phosphogluconolactonase n=1 Tax=Phenylobacterium sp. TaxID=1871053 RepID=UPI002F4122A5